MALLDDITGINEFYKNKSALCQIDKMAALASKITPTFANSLLTKDVTGSLINNMIPNLPNTAMAEIVSGGIFDMVNPLKSILSTNVFLERNFEQLVKGIEQFIPSLSMLNNLAVSYGDIIFRQKEAFDQIGNFPASEKKFLLRHERNQKRAIVLDSEDLGSVDAINLNVSSTINLVNSRANVDTHHIDDTGLAKYIKEELLELLQFHGKGYVDILKGAKEAAGSDNPDKVRQTVVSLRELTNKIVNDLSPDKEVNQWISGKGAAIIGKPSREYRLGYIFRNFSCSNIAPLIENEIKFIPQLINILSEETHEFISEYRDNELALLIDKTESTLLMLLKYSQAK
jgi:hypothetical protein